MQLEAKPRRPEWRTRGDLALLLNVSLRIVVQGTMPPAVAVP